MKRKGISERERQFNVMVGARIRAARMARGVSGKQLALAAGISDSQVYFYEIGHFRCPPFVLDAFARELDVSLRCLVPRLKLSGKSNN